MKTIYPFNFDNVDPSWYTCLQIALEKVSKNHLNSLVKHNDWLPGKEKVFNAFSLPLSQTKYILMGESPYPRSHSANGYSFWDAHVGTLWSPSGLSKAVNRATSLRNLIKMMLVAEGKLKANDTSQTAIAAIDKSDLVINNQDLFGNFLKAGFLLLNATPVLRKDSKIKDARVWQPFIHEILNSLARNDAHVKVLLFGRIAQAILPLLPSSLSYLQSEHPYNHSFIQHQEILDFFRPLHLLRRN